MRINNKVLRSRLSGSAKHCQFLDLSSLSIDLIEGLDAFGKLQTLKLSHNNIDVVSNLECCTNLWNLDLSHNQIQYLEGLERFLALGTLSLSRNNLTWSELARIQHMHILNLSLHSNPLLQRDPYYRLHVIDCLPNVWMLDGRIITSGERIQVEQFFNDSALGEHPVRHKLPKRRFKPSLLSQREIKGVFGEKAVHLFTRFSTVSQLNRELDWQRVRYLAYNLQEDLQLEAYHTKASLAILRQCPTFLELLISARDVDRPACNMILMLLVASLEFHIPEQLLQDTLSHAKLHTLGSLETIGMFLLPSETRCSTVSLLLSAAKVDRDSGEDGGLYDKLYLSLYFCVSELAQFNYQPTTDIRMSGSKQLIDSRSLLAAEIVQLFCIVPTFFDYITKDSGVMKIVTMATGCHDMVQVVQATLADLEANQMSKEECYVVIANLLLSSIQKNVLDICQHRPTSRGCREHFALKTGKCIPKKPVHVSLVAADYQSQGQPSPRRRLHRTTSARLDHRNPCSKSADLGDRILLGPQVIGRIISIPEPDLVLVQLPEIPAENGAMIVNFQDLGQHYTYQDLEKMCWDAEANYWRLKGTQGDRITFHKIPEDEVLPTSRPKSRSTVHSSSSVGRRRGTVVPPGALPLSDENDANCLPSVAATYKAIHQLSLVVTPLTRPPGTRQPSPTATCQQNSDQLQNLGQRPSPDSYLGSEGNGEEPTTVKLLGKEVWSRNSGTEPNPTRPNSASSEHGHERKLTSEDESLTDQENLAEESDIDDDTADSQFKGNTTETKNLREFEDVQTAEPHNENQNDKELKNIEDNKGQHNNKSREEQAGSQSSAEHKVYLNSLELDDSQKTAEDEDNQEAEDGSNWNIAGHEGNQETKEDDDNQNIAEHEDNHKAEEDEDNHKAEKYEDNHKAEEDEDSQHTAEQEDNQTTRGVEYNGNAVEQEDRVNTTEFKNQKNIIELRGKEIEDDEGSLHFRESAESCTESKLEVGQSLPELEEDQNVVVELDLNEKTLENNYERERKIEQQEIASDGEVMHLMQPHEEISVRSTVVLLGENEGKIAAEFVANENANATRMESVEKTLPSAGSQPEENRSLETGGKESVKHFANSPRNAKLVTRGQQDKAMKYAANDANKRVIASSSDLPFGNFRLVVEGNSDSYRTEEATTIRRKNIFGVRFLEPPSALRVDQDTERHNYTHSTGWLGEGRDLYRERIVRHPQHVPGWMEGLTFRPSTSLSARRRLMQFPGQSSSEVSQRRRVLSQSAPALGRRTQKLVTKFEVLDLFNKNNALPSTYYIAGGKLRPSPSIVRGNNQLQPRLIQASTSKSRALPMCRDCLKKHGRGEPCFRAPFSANADDADAMPYEEFFRLHLPSPSGADEHLL